MPMSLAERADLDNLKEEAVKLKCSCFNKMTDLMKLTDAQLVHTGHKTKEAGLKWYWEQTYKQIQKNTEDFLKKYPD